LSLGDAELLATLNSTGFQNGLKALERDVIASFNRMAGASEGIIPDKAFSGATTGAARAKKAIDPLEAAIKALSRETNSYRNIVEATDVSNADAIKNFDRLRTSALKMADGLEVGSKAQRDLTQTAAQAARSVKTLEGQQTRLGFSGNTVVGVNRSMLGGFRNLIGVVGGLSFAGAIKGSFDYATNLEQLGVSFKTILGSGEAAKGLLTELESFAASTPFQFPELANAAKSLAAFGVAGDDIVPTLQRVGDVSAGVGASVGEIAEIYGKARVQGRLFAEDINQLTGRGIPIIQELAKQFGVAESEVKSLVESGQVDFGNLEQAFVSLTSEGGKFFGLTQAQSETTAGKLSTLADNATAAGGQFIEVLLPSLEKTVDVASGVAGGLADMDPGLRALVVQGGLGSAALIPLTAGLGTVVSVAPKVAAGLKLIRTASLSLFLPPTGLFIAGAAAVVGLGVVLYRLSQDTEPVADTLARLKTESAELKTGMQTAADGVDILLKATDENGLKGAVENLSGLLTGDAKTAFVTLADQAIASGADVEVVTQKILEGFLRYQAELIRFQRDTTQAQLGAAQKALQQLQMAAGDPQLESIRAEIAAQEQLIGKLRERQQTVGDVSDEEIATIDANLVANRELEASYVQAGQGHLNALAEQQAEVGALTNVVDGQTKALDELEAAANNPNQFAENQRQSATVTGVATDATNENTDATNNNADAVSEASTEYERAVKATQDYAYTLKEGVLQGVRPAEGALHLLTTALERQQGIQRTLSSQGKFGENYKLAAEKAEILTTAINQLTGEADGGLRRVVIPAVEAVAVAAKDLPTPEVEAFAGELQNIPVEPLAAVVAEAENLEFPDLAFAVSDLTGAYDDAIARAELFGDAENETAIKADVARQRLEELLALGLKPTDAQVQAVAKELRVLQAELDALADSEVEIPIPDVKPIVDYAAVLESQLPDAYRAAEAENTLFNEGLSTAEVRAGVARDKLQELKDQGLDPQSEAVQLAAGEWNKYQAEVDSAAFANELLGEAFGKLTDLAGEHTSELAKFIVANGRAGDSIDAQTDAIQRQLDYAVSALENFASNNPVGAIGDLVTGVADGFIYLWNEATGKNAADEAQAELNETLDLLLDINDALDESAGNTQNQALENRQTSLDNYLSSRGDVEDAYSIAEQANIDILNLTNDFVDDLANLEQRRTDAISLAMQIDDPVVRQQQLTAIDQQFDGERTGLENGYNGNVTAIQTGAYNQAEAAGVAPLLLTAELNKGNASVQTALEQTTLAGQIGVLTGQDVTALNNRGTDLSAAAANSDSLFASALASMNTGAVNTLSAQSNTLTSLLGTQGSAIASALVGYGTLLADSATLSGDFVNSALAASLSGEVGALVGRSNILGTAITDTANRVSSTHLLAGNFEKDALFKAAASKQTQQQTSVNGLVAGIAKSGNFEGSKIIEAANFVATQHLVGSKTGVSAIFNSAVGQVKQLELGSNLLAKTTVGGGNHVIKADATAALAKAKQFLAGGRLQVDNLFASFQGVVSTALSGNNAVASALGGNKGAASLLKNVNINGLVSGALGGGGGNLASNVGDFAAGQLGKVGVEDNIEARIRGLFSADQLNLDTIKNIANAAIDFLKAPKEGSLDYLDKEISDLTDEYNRATDPKKRKELAKKINDLKKQRDKMDVLNPGSGGSAGDGKKGGTGSGTSSGKGAGTGSGSGKGGSSGTGSKKDGSTYSGGKPENYPEGSPGWFAAKMAEIEEQIKRTSSKTKIGQLQAAKEKLQAQLDTLLGQKDAKVPKPAKGSIDYLQEQIQKEQTKFDGAVTDRARAESSERLRVLKAELEEKQAILKDAEKEIARDSSNVITIESPIANLDGIIQLSKALDAIDGKLRIMPFVGLEENLETQFGKAIGSVKGEFKTMPFTGMNKGFATQLERTKGKQAISDKLPDFTASSTLPAYQAQLETSFSTFDSSTVRFDNATIRFDRAVSEFVRGSQGGRRDTSTITDKARGNSLSVFGLQP